MITSDFTFEVYQELIIKLYLIIRTEFFLKDIYTISEYSHDRMSG